MLKKNQAVSGAFINGALPLRSNDVAASKDLKNRFSKRPKMISAVPDPNYQPQKGLKNPVLLGDEGPYGTLLGKSPFIIPN